MIVLAENLVLSPTFALSANQPLIGWHNLVTAANVSATSEAAGFPISNVANPITAPGGRWRADYEITGEGEGEEGGPAVQSITIAVNSVEELDYVAIARHNLASIGAPITIYGQSEEGEGEGEGFAELVQETLLANDGPALFRFEKQALTDIRIDIGIGSSAPEIAVIYAGALLILQRRIFVGHTPIPYGREANIINGRSEAGDFLGRIVLSEMTATAVDLQNIDPAFYRSDIDPFILASKETPFFFAWRPGDYPGEVGFAWMANSPKPVNQRTADSDGLMQIDLQMTGISL